MLAAMAEAISIQLSDGTELWATVRGTGQPVVFVHGGPGLWNYLDELAALVQDVATVIGFDQRGCGRSGGRDGPFTIAQAVADLDELRAALGFDRWVLVGHSWGAELALRYAARHPDRATAVVYIAGVGAGDGFRDSYVRERERRLGPGLPRFTELTAIPANERAPDEEQERCLLLWETDFAPGESAAEHALALWRTRPPDAVVNMTANQLLSKDRANEDLPQVAARVHCPVRMIFGNDDPRPWTASNSVYEALPNATRVVLEDAGHSPWAERPVEVREALLAAIRPE